MCFLYLIEKLFRFCFHLFGYMLVRMIHAAHLSECIVYFLSCSLIKNNQFQAAEFHLIDKCANALHYTNNNNKNDNDDNDYSTLTITITSGQRMTKNRIAHCTEKSARII